MGARDGGGRSVGVEFERSRHPPRAAGAQGSTDDAARWRAFYDSGVAAVAIYAPDGTLRATNERMSLMWNVSDEQAAQLLGHYNILHDEQQRTAGIDEHIRRAFAGERVDFPLTRYVVEPPGGGEVFVKWVRGSFCPVLEDGCLREVVLTLLDVTDVESAREEVEGQRQRAEQQLRDIEHLYDTSPIGLCFMDTDLRFLRINDKMAEINGRPKREHLGRTLREVLPELADSIEPLYREVIESGRPMLHREIAGVSGADPDHEHAWMVSYHPLWDAAGRVEGVGTVVQDITSIKETQSALRESEAQLRTVINHAPVVIWALDREGRFTLSEGRALDNLGLRPGEVVGQCLFDLYVDNPEVVEAAKHCLSGHPSQALTPVGSRVFDTHYVPRFAEDGEVVGAFGVAIDVTERERSREERNVLERKVLETQRLESLGVLAGGIAHDFNNLLMGVLGSADLAANEIPVGTPGRSYLKQIETTAVRAAELTNQMLAYSGQGRFIVEPACLNQIVHEMSGLLQTCISKKAVLKFDLEEDLPAVEADASQLRQVVMNLITNASEALDDQPGTILVRTGRRIVSREDLDTCSFGADLVPGACVSLLVSDDGVGMDAATQRHIFDPFFTTKFTGRGLGLAGVLGIVRGHRGAVQVESTPGVGSSFEILLPAAATGVTVSEPTTRPARVEGDSLRVLVADDDEMVLQVASLMLETAGFEVLVACDGQEAVDVFREQGNAIDLVLLDMTMPRLSGEECFEQIRTLRPDVPVILSSGFTEQEARGRLDGEGVAGFVQKPYRAVDLLREVQKVMRLSTRPHLKP